MKQEQNLDKESEEAYNKRQAEPLFHSAKDMIPMEQVQEHFENLQCGYKGCQVIKKDKSYYACIYHQIVKSIGTDFFWYYQRMTDNDLERMTAQQHAAIEKRRQYMQKWLDNYPKGTST